DRSYPDQTARSSVVRFHRSPLGSHPKLPEGRVEPKVTVNAGCWIDTEGAAVLHPVNVGDERTVGDPRTEQVLARIQTQLLDASLNDHSSADAPGPPTGVTGAQVEERFS